MKINFKVKLTGFGQEIKSENGEPVFLNKTLANLLGMDPHKDTGIGLMDALEWAGKINKGEDVDISKSEQELLKKFIENHANLTAFAKGDLLKCFAKGDEKEKPE